MHILKYIFVVMSLIFSNVYAQTTTFTAVSDVTLIENFNNQDLANGGADSIYVGFTQRAGERRALLRFDLSAIPATANIDSAILKLTFIRGHSDTMTVSLHKTLNSWGEDLSTSFGGAGDQALANDATWKYRFFGLLQLWDTQGGDFSPIVSASKSIPGLQGVTHDISSAGLLTDVQNWVIQPNNNYGWTLIGDASAKAYASRENATAAFRPQLIVSWTPAANSATDVPLPMWVPILLALIFIYSSRRFLA
ncbi:MAG: DNRLRE domain-containing protein [Methylophilaceae bacterium]